MSRRLPPLTALRAFETAARHRSFARAATELHVTPAAISQQVKQREDYFGLPLFKRGKNLSLTESAMVNLPLLSEAFDLLERASARLRMDRQNAPLVVSTPPTFAARWLVGRLDDFQSRHPEIELRLLATRRLVDFDVEDVDVAVRFGSGPYTDLSAEQLMPEAIIPVAAPGLAASLQTANDLSTCTLLHDDGNEWDPAFPDWDSLLATLDVKVDGALRIRHFGDTNLVIQAATSGLGVALAWRSLVMDDLATGRLVQLFDSALPTQHSYHLVTPPDRLAIPKVAAFRDWLLEQGMLQITP